MPLAEIALRVRGLLAPSALGLWYSPAYRLPLTGVTREGLEPRRADFVAWWLVDWGAVRREDVRTPARIAWYDLDRVHTPEYLESLGRPDTLGRIFAADPSDVPVDELLATVRLGCGATVEAARLALRSGDPQLNLLGGFHHASPAGGGGFCPVNDVAVAVAVLRAEGFGGKVAVIDLDAHPPDGLAACFAGDGSAWVGSLSGSDWGPLPGVDETVLPEGSGDAPYLEALEGLLRRMPRPALAFVIAGGDVLAGDRMGRLGLTLGGARRRDRRVAAALRGVPAVWLPGGGYSEGAWRVLAGTGMVLSRGSLTPIPPSHDPMHVRFGRIARQITPDLLGETELTREDLEEALGLGQPREQRLLLGYYTASGLEHALHRYGILEQLRRIGYGQFRVVLDRAGLGERARLLADGDGAEHLLVELVVERRALLGRDVLFVHWLSLRNPRAQFSDVRPRLPGQEVPGLGLAREFGEMLGLMAQRLSLAGVAFRPAHLHIAFAARESFAFVDPERQGRFQALVRDLAPLSILDAWRALDAGRVRLNGAPYVWEPDDMAYWLGDPLGDPARTAAERERCHFAVDRPRAGDGAAGE
ncbi:MAG TPA: histone deacetylase [Anaeromyxobacteraceae bacterium]|jgi:acetoin utilization deacetylase AcuC-like enzyme